MNTTLATTNEALKALVQEKYSAIAETGEGCGCGPTCCSTTSDVSLPTVKNEKPAEASCCAPTCCSDTAADGGIPTVMNEDYTQLAGYVPDADLALGCGIPTQFAQIRSGNTVVDLGSGAGNDAFVARALVGNNGRVIGVDFTEAMVAKARTNNAKMGFTNVEFVQGDIENMPLSNDIADVVVSNCVLNLVPNKHAAFSEVLRIMKSGAHFAVSDIVVSGTLPKGIQQAAEMYAGCVSGAIAKAEYLEIIEKTGFANVSVPKEREIHLPDELLLQYLTPAELKDYRASGARILSITVYGEKP
ncbi:MAG: arsenite methyltransferase [Ignavibacteria bacterium]|nr:arsenite methyltransferase [Ignavibacteria bacterium]